MLTALNPLDDIYQIEGIMYLQSYGQSMARSARELLASFPQGGDMTSSLPEMAALVMKYSIARNGAV